MRDEVKRTFESLGITMLEFLSEVQIRWDEKQHALVCISAKFIIKEKRQRDPGEIDVVEPGTSRIRFPGGLPDCGTLSIPPEILRNQPTR